MNKLLWGAVALSVVGALVLTGCQATRAGYSSAPYQVVRSAGNFEVRDYPALMLAETPMPNPDRDTDGGFKRLFGFITGRNDASQKISMTTPVYLTGGTSNRTMAFVMPAGLDSAKVPRPTDEAIAVREVPAGRFAVLRFRGGRNPSHESEMLAALRKRMTSEGLTESSGPVYGYFDPPWTPPWFRRNEVMLRTEAQVR